MVQPLVVVIDPDPERRQTIQALLSRRYRVASGAEPHEVQRALCEQRPRLLALSMAQVGGTGLDFATRLRTLSGDTRLRIVVYGLNEGAEPLSRARRRALAARHHADHYIAQEPVLELLIETVGRLVPVVQVETTGSPDHDFQLQVMSARRQLPDHGESTEDQSTNARLWELLTLDIGMQVLDQLDEDLDGVSWNDLLRARANLDNLVRLLTKKIHLRHGHQGTG